MLPPDKMEFCANKAEKKQRLAHNPLTNNKEKKHQWFIYNETFAK